MLMQLRTKISDKLHKLVYRVFLNIYASSFDMTGKRYFLLCKYA